MTKPSRFVSTKTKRLDLSNGDWIDIKARLNIDEQKALESSPMTSVRQGAGGATPEEAQRNAEIGLNWGGFYMTKLITYIVDWSFTDDAGQPVACTAAAIRALDPDSADECTEAINTYLNEVAQERVGKGASNGKPKLAVSS